jgi:hypothetical protein
MRVTESATYCVLFSEHQTFKQARAAKAMVRFAPGDYPLGTTSNIDVRLPACFRSEAAVRPAITMAAPLSYTSDVFPTYDFHRYVWEAPIENGGSKGLLQTRLTLRVPAGSEPLITLDGVESTIEPTAPATYAMMFCETSEECGLSLALDSCTYETATLHEHTVTFAGGGQVELSLRIGESLASTEPGAFTRAAGTWSGSSFDQADYFKLIYVPLHHHFARSFIVLFDEPIAGACGLRVSDLDPFMLAQGTAATVDCELNDIAAVTIQSHQHMTQ